MSVRAAKEHSRLPSRPRDPNECELLAVALTKNTPHAAVLVDLLNTFDGRADIPIGTVRDGEHVAVAEESVSGLRGNSYP